MTGPKLKRQCWAAPLGGCSPKISKEHVLSDCVNEAMGSLLSVDIPHAPFRISTDAMRVRYLCSRHNGLLSDIDDEAGKLVKALRDFHVLGPRLVSAGAPKLETVDIDGTRLERWGLKTFLNYALWTSRMPADTPTWSLAGIHIMEYVFGKGPRPAGCGFYVYPGGKNPTDALLKKLFKMETQNMKAKVFKVATNSFTPEFNLPAFLRLTIFGGEMAFCGNITTVGYRDWDAMMNGLLDHPQKHASLHPPHWTFGVTQPPLGPEQFSRMSVRFQW